MSTRRITRGPYPLPATDKTGSQRHRGTRTHSGTSRLKRIQPVNPQARKIRVRRVHQSIEPQCGGGDLRIRCEVASAACLPKQTNGSVTILGSEIEKAEAPGTLPFLDDKDGLVDIQRIFKSPGVRTDAQESKQNAGANAHCFRLREQCLPPPFSLFVKRARLVVCVEKQVGVWQDHWLFSNLRVTPRKWSTSKFVSKSCRRSESVPARSPIRLGVTRKFPPPTGADCFSRPRSNTSSKVFRKLLPLARISSLKRRASRSSIVIVVRMIRHHDVSDGEKQANIG